VPAEDPFQEGQAQDLADRDQTLSDSDQSNADLDQSSADSDQTTSERDQNASDRDQQASDLDQAASDRAVELGLETGHYARTRRARAKTTLQRDLSSQVRSEAGRIRDATAERRDRDADARDAASDARDELAAALDAEIEQMEKSPGEGANGFEILIRAARDRKRAAASRQRAAEQRERAATDRARAREDRRQAAIDREHAAQEIAAEGLDHLTETLRRRIGFAAIQREVDRIARTNEALVVAFVDVDGLKAINDTRGHAAGDAVLQDVARCIKIGLRPYDVILRYGGDEFVCSLAGEKPAGIRQRFNEITTRIAETSQGASISVGLAEWLPQESVTELIARADQAMLETRNGGDHS
jgi:diguanylate cyclase (GGDEF)-like protein